MLCGLVGLALAAGASAAAAQVSNIGGVREARLSGSCHSIDNRENVTLQIGDARIRRGGAARFTGVRQSVYVEAGGVAEVFGVGSFVYVAKGGKATVGGTRNQVVAEQGGNVILVGQAVMTVVDMIDVQVHQNSSECR